MATLILVGQLGSQEKKDPLPDLILSNQDPRYNSKVTSILIPSKS
jgi:hypothetical protein